MYPSALLQDIFVERGKGTLAHPLRMDWPPNENANYGNDIFAQVTNLK